MCCASKSRSDLDLITNEEPINATETTVSIIEAVTIQAPSEDFNKEPILTSK